MEKISVFHIGPQKAATTWLYYCFLEHPDICVPLKDSVHYFDMLTHKDETWLKGQFPDFKEGQVAIDMTPSYVRSVSAARRIYEHNPDAKIIVCLREPVARAFSHYWHVKKKGRYNFKFTEALESYDLFSNWIQPGFYVEQIKAYLEFFPREQILVQQFDHLEKSPENFLKEALGFIGVKGNFTPSALNKKINIAKPKQSYTTRRILQWSDENHLSRIIRTPYQMLKSFGFIKKGEMERLEDVPQAFINELKSLYEPETLELEKLLNIDLKHWK